MVRERLSDERGVVGGADAVAFGALILVVSSIIAVNSWHVVSTKNAVQNDARNVAAKLARSSSSTDFASQLAKIRSNQHSGDTITVIDERTKRPIARVHRCQKFIVEVARTTRVQRVPFIDASTRTSTVRASATAVVTPFVNGSLGAIPEDSPCA